MNEYEQLLLIAQANPTQADFLALRTAYTKTSQYNPYAREYGAAQAFDDAFASGDLQAALDAGQQMLAANYLDIEAHFRMAAVHDKAGEAGKVEYHARFGTGLLNSIITSPGIDFGSAMVVIDTREEYAVMGALRLPPNGQRLVHHEEKPYDVLSTTHPRTGEPLHIYFDISIPFNWLNAQMK